MLLDFHPKSLSDHVSLLTSCRRKTAQRRLQRKRSNKQSVELFTQKYSHPLSQKGSWPKTQRQISCFTNKSPPSSHVHTPTDRKPVGSATSVGSWQIPQMLMLRKDVVNQIIQWSPRSSKSKDNCKSFTSTVSPRHQRCSTDFAAKDQPRSITRSTERHKGKRGPYSRDVLGQGAKGLKSVGIWGWQDSTTDNLRQIMDDYDHHDHPSRHIQNKTGRCCYRRSTRDDG